MGTAAEAIFSAMLLQQKVLLVKVTVIRVGAILPNGLPEDTEGKGAQQIVAGTQGDARLDFQYVGYRDQTGIAFQRRVQTDVCSAAEIFSESMTVDVYRRMVIDFQEPLQTTTVVIVAMGEDTKIHGSQINAQLFRVVCKSTGLTGVEKNVAGAGFDVEAQTMLGSQVVPKGCIFDEGCNFHETTLNENTVTVIDLVLDNLCSPAGKGFQPGLECGILVFYFDFLKSFCRAGPAQQGKAAFLGFVFAAAADDFGIQHDHVVAVTVKGDDAPGHTNHIGCHTHAFLPVSGKGVQQILGGLQIRCSGGGGFSGQQKGVMNDRLYHGGLPFG